MFTSSQNQVNVLRAMKLRKIVGVTPFGADLNTSYAKYFEDCGVGVVAMEGMDIAFGSIPDVPSEVMYSFIRGTMNPTRSAASRTEVARRTPPYRGCMSVHGGVCGTSTPPYPKRGA